MPFLLDTSAWIEYFNRTEKGKKIYDALGFGDCGTSIATIPEIVNWALKKNRDFIPLIEGVKAKKEGGSTAITCSRAGTLRES